MFPHTVTLYNLTENQTTFEKEYNVTVLRGVLLDAVQAANINKSGLLNADSVTLYIPFGVDSGGKGFLPEREYERSEDKPSHWTLRKGKDFFVKGEIAETGKNYEQINGMFDDVYRISTVDAKDFGSPDMRHWECGGR